MRWNGLDTELPSPALVLLFGSAPLFWLGVACAVSSGILAGATLAGIARRTVSRSAGWRGLSAAIVAILLACASLGASLYLAPGPYRSAGEPLLDSSARGISLAFLTTLLFACVSALLTRAASPRRGIPRLAGNLARVFTPFWRRRGGNGQAEEAGEPEFEITMTSGEQVEQAERELIENILEMGDTTVREVMKPRPDVIALDSAWGAERILAEVAGSRYSRYPVYDGSVDNVAGVLHLRDLFEFLARGDGLAGFDIRQLVKEPYYLPESRKVDEALRDLQKEKCHLAVVLDEFGGTAGIVTIEDLLEEIVGEIQDEYDDESKLAHQREDGSWVVTAQLQLDDLNELLDSSLEAEDVDTLGGYIVHELGRIPAVQDSLDQGGLRFTVLSVERNRVGRVKIDRIAP